MYGKKSTPPSLREEPKKKLLALFAKAPMNVAEIPVHE